MLFRIGRCTAAEIGYRRVGERLIEVNPVVHVGDLVDEVERILVAAFFGNEEAVFLPRIAPQCEDIVDAHVMQLDQGVFGVFLRKPSANQVRHGVYFVALLDHGADAHRSWTLAGDDAVEAAIRSFAQDEVFAVIGDINERRIEIHQRIDAIPQLGYIPALERWKYFKTEQGFVAPSFDMIGYFHALFRDLPARSGCLPHLAFCIRGKQSAPCSVFAGQPYSRSR